MKNDRVVNVKTSDDGVWVKGKPRKLKPSPQYFGPSVHQFCCGFKVGLNVVNYVKRLLTEFGLNG